MIKKIFIILPYKESLKSSSSGAVSIYVKDTLKFSKYRKKTKIISSEQFKKKIFLQIKTISLIFVKNIKKQKLILLKYTIDRNI